MKASEIMGRLCDEWEKLLKPSVVADTDPKTGQPVEKVVITVAQKKAKVDFLRKSMKAVVDTWGDVEIEIVRK